jgi:pyridoxamine 5'-phosphate oxidase
MEPCSILGRWLKQAEDARVPKANAMCLSTVDAHGLPSSRMILVHRATRGGLVFCTDSRSKKAKDFAENPHACALLYWPTLHKQIRVEGRVETACRQFAEDDFDAKTHEQKVLVTICEQSASAMSFRSLERELKVALAAQNPSQLRTPAHWQAYLLRAEKIELFLGGKNRLNRRLLLSQTAAGWRREVLLP